MPHAIGTKVLTLLALAGAMALTLRAGECAAPGGPAEGDDARWEGRFARRIPGQSGDAVIFFLTTCSHCQETTKVLGPIYDEWKSRGLEITRFGHRSK